MELDEFLLSDACDEDTLSLDEAHGFITALVVGPDREGEWLGQVWGEPRFADAAEASRMRDLMQRLYDDVDSMLRSLHFEPLVIEEEDEGEVYESYEGWCFGFMLGVEQHEEQWESLPKEPQALLAPMAQIALLESDDEAEMDEEEYAAWVELIPGAVTGLYQFWHGVEE